MILSLLLVLIIYFMKLSNGGITQVLSVVYIAGRLKIYTVERVDDLSIQEFEVVE